MVIPATSTSPPLHRASLPRAAADALVVVACCLFAAAYVAAIHNGRSPYVFLSGDAANIASFAAAWDDPVAFAGDAVLGKAENFRHYFVVQIPLVRALSRITGDSGSAFHALLFPQVFLQLLSLYVFGVVLLRSRAWAVVLVVALTPGIAVSSLGEIWGLWRDALPRCMFTTLVPLCWSGAVAWHHVPRRHPALMAAAGLLMYVHPVSAPAWGFALWLSLGLGHATLKTPLLRALRSQILSAACFVAVAVPFVVVYLGHHSHGAQADYARVNAAVVRHLGATFFHVGDAATAFGKEWLTFPLVVQVGWLGAVLLLWSKEYGTRAAILLEWALAIVFVSVVLPAIDQLWARTQHGLPVEVDLVRGLRYLIPASVAAGVLFLGWLARCGTGRARLGAVALSLTLAGGALRDIVHDNRALRPLIAWLHSAGAHPSPVDRDRMTLARALAALPADARVLPASTGVNSSADFLETRYFARRALVHAWKDGNILSYANPEALLRWEGTNRRLQQLHRKGVTPAKRLAGLVVLARELGATHIVAAERFNTAALTSAPVHVVSSGRGVTLLAVEAAPPASVAR